MHAYSEGWINTMHAYSEGWIAGITLLLHAAGPSLYYLGKVEADTYCRKRRRQTDKVI